MQKGARMTFGAVCGLMGAILNRTFTDMNFAHEESRIKYQKKIGRTIQDKEFKEIARKEIDEHQESLISLASKHFDPNNPEKHVPHLEKTKMVCQAAFADLGLKESNLIIDFNIIKFIENPHLGGSVRMELKFINDIPVYGVIIHIPRDQEFTEKFYRELYAVAGHEAIHTTQMIAQNTIDNMKSMAFLFTFPIICKLGDLPWVDLTYSSSLISKIFEIDADLRSAIRLKTAGDLKEHLLETFPPHERNTTEPEHPATATRIKYLSIISKFQGENSSLFFKAHQKITCQNQMESLDRQSEQTPSQVNKKC